jgi:hypothetical protein
MLDMLGMKGPVLFFTVFCTFHFIIIHILPHFYCNILWVRYAAASRVHILLAAALLEASLARLCAYQVCVRSTEQTCHVKDYKKLSLLQA